jgi:hypothetical protein
MISFHTAAALSFVLLNLARAAPSPSGAGTGFGPRAAPVLPGSILAADDESRFNSVRPDCKKPQELSEGFFNPFKVHATVQELQKKEGSAVSNETVIEAIASRGVSGMLFAAQARMNRAIIGDQVFAIGEELTFPSLEKGGQIPLLAGATVVLRRVRSDSLGLDVTTETEPARQVNFPLRNFWQP